MKYIKWFFLCVVCFLTAACEKVLIEDDLETDPMTVFETLWNFTNEHYTFFDIKKEAFGLDWDEVYTRYRSRVNSASNQLQLFDILAEMLNELKDGHSNLFADFKTSFYNIELKYPTNFDFDLVRRNYLVDGDVPTYNTIGGYSWAILEEDIGYVRFSSFGQSTYQIDYIISEFLAKEVKGMILDVRGNGGGFSSGPAYLMGRFIKEKTAVGYTLVKTGSGPDDWSEPLNTFVEPLGLNFDKPVMLLTNRGCYSATSHFVEYMRHLPNVTTIGDWTGGGGGTPGNWELPNGWSFRISADAFHGITGWNIEEGSPPDIEVADDETTQDIDEIIERAILELQ